MTFLSRRDTLSVIFLFLFGLFLSAPFLFFGRAFTGEEHMGFYYAISFWVHQSLTANMPLVWQSGYYGGVSASLDQFVGAWYPLNQILFRHFGFFTAHHLSIFFATTTGLILSYWFGRTRGWSAVPSLTLALGYLSATTYAWLSIGTTAAHSFMILPGLLLALVYVAEKRDAGTYLLGVLWGSIMIGVGLLAGFVQIVFYVICIGGAYALFLDLHAYSRIRKWYQHFSASLSYAGMVCLGLVLGFAQFFPSAHLIGYTIRTSTYALQNVTYANPIEFIALFLPPYYEIPYLGGGSSPGLYLGAIGLIFAIFSVVYFRTKEIVFFAGLYVLILLLAFHVQPFGWLNEHIPPFSHMGGNFRWMVAGAFPLAYLAAVGVHGFTTTQYRLSSRGWRIALWSSGIISLLCVLGSALVALVVRHLVASPALLLRIVDTYASVHALAYPHEHYIPLLIQALEKLSALFLLSNPQFLFGVVLWVFAFFFLFWYWAAAHKRFMGSVIVALFLCATAGTWMLQWGGLAAQSLYETPPPLAQTILAKETDAHAYRVMGFALGDGIFEKVLSKHSLSAEEITRMQMQLLIDNSNLYWGIERMDGLEPYRTLRANQLINTVVAYDTAAVVFDSALFERTHPSLTQLVNTGVQKRVSLTEKMQDVEERLPLISMMNVKYVYSLYPLEAKQLTEIPTPALIAGNEHVPLYLYRNEAVLPRLYVANSVKYASGGDAAVLSAILTTQDFSKETWVECNDCTMRSRGGAVHVDSYVQGSVAAEVDSRGGFLVFTESALPGWEAAVDGVTAPIYTANYLFQAVYVPEGNHHVVFTYHDVTKDTLQKLTASL